ncbi:unnamed protein product, partial [Mesorhabditis belari]|uniref:Uncharacterized protein n=1 Tax=Mesorhabditis belari TaxID=2138241 RepID=A0AAF3EU91_9BILA
MPDIKIRAVTLFVLAIFVEIFNAQSISTTNPSTSSTNGTCTWFSACYTNNDCNGGSCVGFALNTCNCWTCVSSLPCQSDSTCGGLVGACNAATKSCDCLTPLVQAGYPDLLSVLTKFCFVQTCSAGCYGLPCNKGICVSCPLTG